MGLKEAVLDIAQQMEEEAKEAREADQDVSPSVLRAYASAVRAAAKAAPDALEVPNDPADMIFTRGKFAPVPPGAREKEQMRKVEEAERMMVGSNMVRASGGPDDGTMVPCEDGMPVGAFCHVGGSVYTLTTQDGFRVLRYVGPREAKG